MKILIFFLGYLLGKIITDIQVLIELKEVGYDKKNPRIFKQQKRGKRNAKGIFSNERSIDF